MNVNAAAVAGHRPSAATQSDLLYLNFNQDFTYARFSIFGYFYSDPKMLNILQVASRPVQGADIASTIRNRSAAAFSEVLEFFIILGIFLYL